MSRSRISRRTFLRGAGVGLALPLLDAMLPCGLADPKAPPRRMVCICTGLGLHAENLFPRKPGRDYELTPYLEVLKDLRGEFTLFSGLSHPEVDGGHSSEGCFLTAAAHPGQSSFKNTISLDQFALEKLTPDTRFASLQLTTSWGFSLSCTRSGVMIPGEMRPSQVFKKLFVDGTPKEVEQQVARLRDGRSVMDSVLDEAKQLQGEVGTRDRERLDEYFSSVREVERRLQKAEEWARKPKPKVEAKPPQDITNNADIIGRSRLLCDLIPLALRTDSTRFITVSLFGQNVVPPITGVTQDWHNLSHHGKDAEKLRQLALIELEQIRVLRDLLLKLRETREAGGSLLEQTMVLYGSNLGNASSHDTKNLPILLAGGGFRHGQYLAFDDRNNTPLGNLYVSMLRQLGADLETFATGRGALRGLEAK
jgi:hypothetical protein